MKYRRNQDKYKLAHYFNKHMYTVKKKRLIFKEIKVP